MTSGGSRLAERFGQLRAEARAAAAAVHDRAQKASEEAAQRLRERDKVTEQRLQELAERREQAKAKKEQDPNANNQWLQRRDTQDETFRFGTAEEAEQPGPTRTPPPPPAFAPPREDPPVAPQPEPPAPAARAKHRAPRPADDFDDADFSNPSWLQ